MEPVAKTMEKLIYPSSCAKSEEKSSVPDWSKPTSGILGSAKKSRVELSDSILKQRDDGSKEVSFVWDWEYLRGTYWVDGEQTSINRYMINFDEMLQRNLDNDSWRKVKIAKITAE